MRQSVMQGQLEEISNVEDLDESLRDVLVQLNEADYCTVGSCSGYEWEHTGRRKSCNFGPLISIMVYSWEVKKLLSKLKQDLFGTYWNVSTPNSATWLERGNKRHILYYDNTVYCDEKYDLYFSVIFLAYKKNLSDKQIKRGWDILLSRLVGD